MHKLASMVASAALVGWVAMAAAQAPPSAPPPPEKDIPAYVDPLAMALYPESGPARGSESWTVRANGNRLVRNVVRPTLAPVLPAAGTANGAAVIVAPGGGFIRMSMDSEGYTVAHWLASHGITAFVLKYRLREAPGPRAAPAGPPAAPVARSPFAPAVEDALAAVRIVRARAHEWGLDPNRIGYVGFSAGAETALAVALTDDKTARVDFVARIYGPMTAVKVPADAPPLFAAVAADDPVVGNGDLLGLLPAWREARRPVEFHLYESGGHGFGMETKGTTSDHWIDEFYWWMQARGLLKPGS